MSDDNLCRFCIHFVPNWDYCELDPMFNDRSTFTPTYIGKECPKWKRKEQE